MSKPDKCKFCGGSSKLNVTYLGHDKEECFCACNKCRCQTAVYATPEEAIAAWNRKPEDEPITAEGLERLGFAKRKLDRDLVDNSFECYEIVKQITRAKFCDFIHIWFEYGKLKSVEVGNSRCYLVATIQDITDLKRLFLGINGED